MLKCLTQTDSPWCALPKQCEADVLLVETLAATTSKAVQECIVLETSDKPQDCQIKR